MSPRRWLRQGWRSNVNGRTLPRSSTGGWPSTPRAVACRRPRTSRAGASMSGAGKKVLFINQYYWPDHASTAQHLADLAGSMAARGYECHVLCARGRYQPGEPDLPGVRGPRGCAHPPRAGDLAGPSRDPGPDDRLPELLRRRRAQGDDLAAVRRRGDAHYAADHRAGRHAPASGSRARGTSTGAWTSTPTPAWPSGRMSPRNPVVRGLRWLSAFVYRQADRVVVLGPYMADRVALKGVADGRIETIPIWSRREEIYPIPRGSNALRKSLGLGDAFVAMYSGNLGLAHSFDEFIEAARRLRDRSDIVFLFAGAGPRLGEVKAAQEREGLANIRFLDYVPRASLHISLSMADAHLISMRPEMTGIVVPGKLYGVMAAGRPSIFVGPRHCESADTIRTAGCGMVVEQGDVDGLVDALTRLAADTSLVRRMGERGRSAFLAGHEQKLCCARWSDLLSELTRTPPAPSRPLRKTVRTSTAVRPPSHTAVAAHLPRARPPLRFVPRFNSSAQSPSRTGTMRAHICRIAPLLAGLAAVAAPAARARTRPRRASPRSRPGTTAPWYASCRNTWPSTPVPTTATRRTRRSSTRRSSTTGSPRSRTSAVSTSSPTPTGPSRHWRRSSRRWRGPRPAATTRGSRGSASCSRGSTPTSSRRSSPRPSPTVRHRGDLRGGIQHRTPGVRGAARSVRREPRPAPEDPGRPEAAGPGRQDGAGLLGARTSRAGPSAASTTGVSTSSWTSGRPGAGHASPSCRGSRPRIAPITTRASRSSASASTSRRMRWSTSSRRGRSRGRRSTTRAARATSSRHSAWARSRRPTSSTPRGRSSAWTCAARRSTRPWRG